MTFFSFQFSPCSVAEQEDVEGLALETDCLPHYVAKGIALGCFVYARCLHHGLGVEKSREQAKHWYSTVCTLKLSFLFSFLLLNTPLYIFTHIQCKLFLKEVVHVHVY